MSEFDLEKLIQKYNMSPHPEGGFFCETYRSEQTIDTENGKRSVSTAITFLLRQGDISHLHRIKSDELWHFYHGDDLEIFEIDENGNFISTILNNESPQYLVKANRWFGSRPCENSKYSFVGCTVSPGFDFADFEMANCDNLTKDYPKIAEKISPLCLD